MKPHWKVKFMQRGFEPPMPFGKSHLVVAAATRKEAVEIVKASGVVSPRYPKVSASKTEAEVDYSFLFTKDE